MSSIRNSKSLPRPESPAVNDDAVLRACYDCVLDFGVSRVTMADIARRAGVSRMTLYRHHTDLPTLFTTVLREELTFLLATIEADLPAKLDARTSTAQAVAAVTKAVAMHPLMRRVLDVDPESLLPLMVDRLGSTQRMAREHLAGIIAAGMSSRGGDGSVREGDPDLFAFTLTMTAQSFVFSERIVQETDPRAFDELQQLVMGYLAPVGGAS